MFQAFERLKKLQPDFAKKLAIIEGDLEQQQAFSLADDNLQTIHVVIHCAATVRFNESLKKATCINVRGTRQVLELARKMSRLEAFVYVSTAFSFCPHEEIGEEIYGVPIQPEELVSYVESDVEEGVFKDFEKR